MRLATWNLERAKASTPRAYRLRQVMKAVNADVWVLTETDSNLTPEHAKTSISSGLPERQHRSGERWVVIWSRHGNLERVTTADPVRTACARLRRPTGPLLLIYGTVLPWRADVRFRPLRGADAFCDALAKQTEDWSQLRRDNSDHVLCVAGDFNQEIDAPCRVGTSRGRLALSKALQEAGLVCLSSGADAPLGGVPMELGIRSTTSASLRAW